VEGPVVFPYVPAVQRTTMQDARRQQMRDWLLRSGLIPKHGVDGDGDKDSNATSQMASHVSTTADSSGSSSLADLISKKICPFLASSRPAQPSVERLGRFDRCATDCTGRSSDAKGNRSDGFEYAERAAVPQVSGAAELHAQSLPTFSQAHAAPMRAATNAGGPNVVHDDSERKEHMRNWLLASGLLDADAGR